MSQQSGEVTHGHFCPQYHFQSPQAGGHIFETSLRSLWLIGKNCVTVFKVHTGTTHIRIYH